MMLSVTAWRQQEEKNFVEKVANMHHIDPSGQGTGDRAGRVSVKNVYVGSIIVELEIQMQAAEWQRLE